jgi:hypothetical protein
VYGILIFKFLKGVSGVELIEISRNRLMWNTSELSGFKAGVNGYNKNVFTFSVKTIHLGACNVFFIVISLLGKPIKKINDVPSYCVRFDLFNYSS